MSVEGTSSIESSEVYGFYTGATEESDREERSTKERDRYSSIFSETVRQPLNQAHQNKGRKPLMNRAPDIDVRAGYNERDGKFAEISIHFSGSDSSKSESTNNSQSNESTKEDKTSDQSNTAEKNKDSK